MVSLVAPPAGPSFAQIALDVPILGALTYSIPDQLRGQLRRGQLVQVPFRNRSKIGLVVDLTDEVDDELAPKVRDVVDIIDREPLLGAAGLDFLRFLADYYMAPLGDVARLAIPAAVRLEGAKHYTRLREFDASAVPAHLQLLYASLEYEPVAVQSIRESSNFTYTELAALEDVGAVEVGYAEEQRVSVKTERFYRLVDGGGDGAALGTRQQGVVDYLQDEGEVGLAHLRDSFGAVHSSLNRLVDRGVICFEEREVYRDPFADVTPVEASDGPLTDDQELALTALNDARIRGTFRAFLLHGVTGSGKTRVYVEAIRAVIDEGRSALVLLPEIALTPQFVAVFRGYFDGQIAVLHSGLSVAEKFDEWRRIRRGEVAIVIGARSALFAPLANIGIIVVDEEHDPSFKQEEGARYNARDMALVRGKLEDAIVVLGSATPSLESFHNANEGRFGYLTMPRRVFDRPMPEVELVDLRRRGEVGERRSEHLSDRLLDALDQTLTREQQAILFLNRRGFSPCVVCEVCGHVWRCDNCDVSLTYHRRQESLRCHHCDHSMRLPERCPACNNHGVGPRGVGTEQLEGHLRGLFPNHTCGRLDRDTSGGRRLQQLIQRFSRREIDILVGTQMVTKGHDFPGVTTVGVVLADLGLNFPDFRGAERTFQLLTQVAGRAGRGDDPGRVFVQTYSPEHFALTAVEGHDYQAFASAELLRREMFGYPPFGHLVAVKFEAVRESAVASAARDYLHAARRRLRSATDWGDATVKGPAPAPFERLRGKTRWQMLFQGTDRSRLRRLVASVLNDVGHFDPERKRAAHVIVDVDPISML